MRNQDKWICPLRVSSIKTRIKTPVVFTKLPANRALRVSSIKTRIKTLRYSYVRLFAWTLRVSSIKTRIKTEIILSLTWPNSLWEYLPLKQGLRLSRIWFNVQNATLRVSSIKTRIKTNCLHTLLILFVNSESIFH